MRQVLTKIKGYYDQNGIVGIASKKLIQSTTTIRGGSYDPYDPDPDPYREIRGKLEALTSDKDISNHEKDPFLQVKDERFKDSSSSSVTDLISSARRKFWAERGPDSSFNNDPAFRKLRESVIAKSKHPLYSQVKSKLPTAILLPITSMELKRLAAYRMLGFTSAPLTIGAYLGLALPCAVTFSMLEMYVPDNFKLPCKALKWGGGCVYYFTSYGIDCLTRSFEKKHFGTAIPIDAQQTMGTLPTTNDVGEIYQLAKELAEEFSTKTY